VLSRRGSLDAGSVPIYKMDRKRMGFPRPAPFEK
jgi:hypothetical protein